MSIWTKEEEGEALRKRFDDLKRTQGISRAKFAKDHGLNGGDSMVYQHITGHRPMSMEAAIAYAKAFTCELHEISPRLAEEAKQMAVAIWSNDEKTKEVVNQEDSPQATAVIKPKTRRQERIDMIVELLQQTDMEGLAVILDRAKDAARDYPAAKETLVSSA